MSYPSHIQASQNIIARFAVVTLSDTRTPDTDTSGQRIQLLALNAGHSISHYQLIPDELAQLETLLRNLLAREDVDVILTNGGTGISRRDQTVGVIQKHLTQPLPGFGELFRMLSYQQIGSGAMLSQALAGVVRTDTSAKLLFALPGSTKAVELAMSELILKEIKHLLHELRK